MKLIFKFFFFFYQDLSFLILIFFFKNIHLTRAQQSTIGLKKTLFKKKSENSSLYF